MQGIIHADNALVINTHDFVRRSLRHRLCPHIEILNILIKHRLMLKASMQLIPNCKKTH